MSYTQIHDINIKEDITPEIVLDNSLNNLSLCNSSVSAKINPSVSLSPIKGKFFKNRLQSLFK